MRIIQTKGIVSDGKVKIELPQDFKNGEVDVVIIAEKEVDEFDNRRQIMIEKGYDNPDKILDLIQQIKLEMLEEKNQI